MNKLCYEDKCSGGTRLNTDSDERRNTKDNEKTCNFTIEILSCIDGRYDEGAPGRCGAMHGLECMKFGFDPNAGKRLI